MLAIKLKRIGKKHQPTYRVIVAEKKEKMAGRYAEDLGYWNPHTNQVSIKKERAEHWIKVGAQPTDSVHNLLVRAQIIKDPKRPMFQPKAPVQAEVVAETPATEAKAPEAPAETPAEETPAEATEEKAAE